MNELTSYYKINGFIFKKKQINWVRIYVLKYITEEKKYEKHILNYISLYAGDAFKDCFTFITPKYDMDQNLEETTQCDLCKKYILKWNIRKCRKCAKCHANICRYCYNKTMLISNTPFFHLPTS